jgi:glutamate synthase domain-containing protein 3
MNDGCIIVHGSAGDATGYSMRGGKIYVRGNTGYRCGVHMKEYGNKIPLIVVGGRAGSFVGEYQAGGEIYVLGLNAGMKTPVGYFCGTGIHGGAIYLRASELPPDLPAQVKASEAQEKDMEHIGEQLKEYCELFDLDMREILAHKFFVLNADTKNPYRQMYIH